MSTLYELTGDYQQLLAMAETGEVDPQAIADTMESIQGEYKEKAEGYAKVMRQIEVDAGDLDLEIRRLQDRKMMLQRNHDSMKNALYVSMKKTNQQKFKTLLFSFRIQKNPAHVVMDETYTGDLPKEYLIPQEPKVDRKKIAEDLKAGKDLKFAHLEQTESLRIM